MVFILSDILPQRECEAWGLFLFGLWFFFFLHAIETENVNEDVVVRSEEQVIHTDIQM